MGKFLKALLCFLLGVAVSAGALWLFVSKNEQYNPFIQRRQIQENQEAALIERALEIAGYVKNGDYAAIGSAAHEERGVTFSPYAYLDDTTDKVFTSEQIRAFGEDKTKYIWGVYDGRGDMIELTANEYFKAFLRDHDYTKPNQIGIDTVVRSGNTLENIDTAMKNIRYVDLYVAGADEIDWGSLRLGFEEVSGEFKLVLIMHSQWTI